jgi:hypothetical protein
MPDSIMDTSPMSAEARRERLDLAGRLFREFYATCFWHCPRDLEITEELVAFVAKGLRTYGGRRGFLLAAKLRPDMTRGVEPPGCR